MAERQEQSQEIYIFYKDFREKLEAFVQARGRSEISWDDVLAVAVEHPKTQKVLSEEGISAGKLSLDLKFISYFGRPEFVVQSNAFDYSSLYQETVDSLLNDIRTFERTTAVMQNYEAKMITREILNLIQEYIEHITFTGDNYRKNYLKTQLINETLKKYLEQLVGEQANSLDKDQIESLPGYSSIRSFTYFMKNWLFRITDNPDDPRPVLDSIDRESNPLNGVSAFQLVKVIKDNKDAFREYLLYRNGMLAPEDYQPPTVMPDTAIILHGLKAVDLVTEARGIDVEIKHLLPGLLEDREVIGIITEIDKDNKITEEQEQSFLGFLGMPNQKVRNLVKFYSAVLDSIIPKEEGEKFRHTPVVSSGLKLFLKEVNSIISQGPVELAAARMINELLKKPEIKDIFIKAGLTRTQLKNWPKILKKVSNKKELEAKLVGKKQEEFKVDERELQSKISEYTSDRTKLALEGKVDPLIGREEELNKMLTILLQRGRSNPLLIGEPGVGKTALFDGLAQRIASGNVPKQLLGAKVLMVDLSAMNSGAMYRGMFEERLLPLVQGVAERNAKENSTCYILCIDEIHSALQAGSASNTPGAGELLKPYLTKGELSIIGATTQADYAKGIEPDHALERRFQTIFIEQPSFDESARIVKGLQYKFEAHHGIRVSEDLIPAIVNLTDRYLPNLQQPDKSLRVLDAAFAKARIIGRLELSRDVLIATIAQEAKIAPEFLEESEGEKYLRVKSELPKLVLGQDQATIPIATSLIIAKAGMQDPRRPLGRYLLLGPTGVGKTETGRGLARLLHGSDEAMIRIDMSDYQEKHEASRLVGAPPGYIGFGEEGILTGAVRRKPYSVVVLDEIEKAHPEVLKRFLPILEEGEIIDGRGQRIIFRNTVIIMTSNLGTERALELVPQDRQEDEDFWQNKVMPVYLQTADDRLAPELRNRLDGIFVYKPLSRGIIEKLVDREMEEISDRAEGRWGATIKTVEQVRQDLAVLGYNPVYGARNLKRVVHDQVLGPLSIWLLEQGDKFKGKKIELTGVGADFNVKIT